MRKQPLHPRTAVINQQQKNQSKKSKLDALRWLADTFPEAFDNTESIRPLNLGIMNDILAEAEKMGQTAISKSKLREAVVLFTRRLDYLACLKAREMRIDLYGNPVAQVSEEDALSAALKMKKRIEKTIKNSKKSTHESIKPAPKKTTHNPSSVENSYEAEGFSAYFPERPPAFSVQNNAAYNAAYNAPRASVVTVTHKQSRTYDKDAVARLKEKLGLSRKQEADE